MDEIRLQLSPGDRVLFIEHWLYLRNDWNSFDLDATKGSVGRVLSFSEFVEYYKTRGRQEIIADLQMVQQEMETGEKYPVMLETIGSKDEILKYEQEVMYMVGDYCQPGRVLLLPPLARKLEIIEKSGKPPFEIRRPTAQEKYGKFRRKYANRGGRSYSSKNKTIKRGQRCKK